MCVTQPELLTVAMIQSSTNDRGVRIPARSKHSGYPARFSIPLFKQQSSPQHTPSLALVLLLIHRERILQQILLLLQMHRLQARRHARARVPARVHDVLVVVVLGFIQQGLDPGLGEAPGARVQRLLLAPDDVLGVGVGVEVLAQLRPGEGVQLLDARDGRRPDLVGRAVLVQGRVDLARAENDAFNFFVRGDGLPMLGVGDDPLEVRFAGEVFDARAGEGVAEEGLGEENAKG